MHEHGSPDRGVSSVGLFAGRSGRKIAGQKKRKGDFCNSTKPFRAARSAKDDSRTEYRNRAIRQCWFRVHFTPTASSALVIPLGRSVVNRQDPPFYQLLASRRGVEENAGDGNVDGNL